MGEKPVSCIKEVGSSLGALLSSAGIKRFVCEDTGVFIFRPIFVLLWLTVCVTRSEC